MNLGVMIEGQEGLNWDRWRQIIHATEDLGFESLFRSDHQYSLSGPHHREALETFVSLVLVAELSSRIQFGTLVASMTFRHPSLLARMAAQIDVLSGGRFILGVGAGWHVPEHEAFGFHFPSVRERMDRLEEGIQVVRTLWGDGPASFDGRYYQLKDVECYPKPIQSPAPLLVGGSGERRTLRLVAQYADEWNAVGLSLDAYRHKVSVLEQHCADVGRDASAIRRSMMLGFIVGRDERELHGHLARIGEVLPALVRGDARSTIEGVRERGWLVGTPSEIVDQIGEREAAGVQRIMLQHHAHGDFGTLELLAAEVLPQAQR